MGWIIVDLDGTLCDHSHRVHYAQQRQWEDFHKRMMNDDPVPIVRQVVKALSFLHNVAFLTARPERYREPTEAWIREVAKLPITELYMRPDDDFSSSVELKRRVYEESFRYREVVLVLEDRDKLVQMWRELGLTCFQVRNGEY